MFKKKISMKLVKIRRLDISSKSKKKNLVTKQVEIRALWIYQANGLNYFL